MRLFSWLLLASIVLLGSPGSAFGRVHYSDSEVFVLNNVASVNDANQPFGVAIVSAYPNPFNPRTKIHFKVGTPGEVRLAIYDLRGRMIAPLVEENLDSGQHEVDWCGVDRFGQGVPSGMYFCRLVSGDMTQTHKLVLIR